MSHLLPAITASAASGLADYALSASLLRGAGLGAIAGAVYSATHDALSKKFEVKNGFVAHSVAIITSAVMTFGAVFLAAAAGAMEMPSLATLGAIFAAAITVDALFRAFVAHFTKNEPKKKDVQNPVPAPAQPVPPPVPVADPVPVNPAVPVADPTAIKVPPVNPPPQPRVYPPPASPAPVSHVLPPVVPASGAATPSTAPAIPVQPPPVLVAAGASAAAATAGKAPPTVPVSAATAKSPATPVQGPAGASAAPVAAGKAPLPVPASPATPKAQATPVKQPSVPAAAASSPGKAPSSVPASPTPKEIKQEADIRAAKFPLIEAIRLSRFDIAESLVSKDNVNCEDDRKNTPLSYSVRRGNKTFADKLRALGAKTDCVDNNNYTLLHQAAYSGTLDLVVQYQTKDNLEVAANLGYTPLAIALSRGHDHIVQHLEANGAKLNFKLKTKNTPLHVAVHGGSKRYCTLLMTADNLKKTNKWGATPLADAVMYNQIDIAEEMVSKGADVKTTMEDTKKNLLHLAAEKCTKIRNLQRVHKFCEPGAMEAPDAKGNTPLLLALKTDQPSNAAWLIVQGAKLDCRNNDNETPYSIAKAKNYAEVLKLLEGKGITS